MCSKRVEKFIPVIKKKTKNNLQISFNLELYSQEHGPLLNLILSKCRFEHNRASMKKEAQT